MALFDKIITSESKSNRDSPAPYLTRAQYNSTSLARDRVCKYGTPDCVEEAIYRHHEFLRTLPTDDVDWHCNLITDNLAALREIHASNLGVTEEGLPKTLSPDAEVTSFPHLIASLRARSTTDKRTWVESEMGTKHLRALQSACHATNIVEIGDAIEYC